jgi:diguanylate cyclase (GGDEF)-like protein/PAS domain S-box-containing protein
MHRLLLRQLQRHLGKDFEPEGGWPQFLGAVSDHYKVSDQERVLLGNALAVNSDELTAANQRLRAQSEQEHAQLRGVIDSIPDLIYFKTPEGIYLGCNQAFERYAGLPESSIVGNTALSIFDSATAIKVRARDTEMLASGKAMVCEEWVTYPDGGNICLEVLRTPYFNSAGSVIGLIGIGRNITERKRLEEERRLAALVYQHTAEGMLVTDADYHIIAINPACARITGYELQEVQGKSPNIFNSGQQDQYFYDYMWEAINEVGYWHGEMWDRRKNGEIYAKSITINQLLGDDDSLHGYVMLFSDITEKKQSEDLIWKHANFDMLTGLPNRRMFRDRLAQEIKKERRAGLSLALLFIDLDRFKEVNDTHGHLIGDDLLIEVARRIRSCTRDSDTVARLGGDEFTVILTQLEDSKFAEGVARKIIKSMEEPFELGEDEVYVSASIGITLYPDDALEVEQLLKNADQAMYAAKNMGHGRFSYFTYTLQLAAQSRARLVHELRVALAAGQFRVYFQPIVHLATGRIHKAEALLRWDHPERGMIDPEEFIPLAEESGLIIQIGDWVFREATRWLTRWHGIVPHGFQISVNASPVQFRTEGNISHDAWSDHLKSLGIPGTAVIIEITEGLLLDAEPDIVNRLLRFRDAGIQVAIDDFGTGYSSLSYLKKFDIDYLKIDQSFVRMLGTNNNDRALCEAIIVMAHKLGLGVIAEGVETEEERQWLIDAGCDSMQGFLISEPVTPERFELLLRQSS